MDDERQQKKRRRTNCVLAEARPGRYGEMSKENESLEAERFEVKVPTDAIE